MFHAYTPKEVYIIIGGTSGLGRSLLLKYLNENENALAFVVGRNINNMNLPNNIKRRVTCFSIDLDQLDISTAKKQLFDNMVKKATLEDATITRFFYTAGNSQNKPKQEYTDEEIKKEEWIFTTLPKLLITRYTSYFKQENGGKCIIAGSLAGEIKSCEKLEVYYSCKTKLHENIRKLHASEKKSNVSYILIMPVQMKDTNFHERGNFKTSPFPFPSSVEVARITYLGDKKEKQIILPGFICKVMYYLNKWFPNLIIAINNAGLG